MRLTVRMAIVKENLWYFGRILGDLNDVAVSSARAASLEGAFPTHRDLTGAAEGSAKRKMERMLGRCWQKEDRQL
jgi:hypothetical protein